MSSVKAKIDVKIIAGKMFWRSGRLTSCREFFFCIFLKEEKKEKKKINSNIKHIFRVNFGAVRVSTCNAVDYRRHLQFTYAEWKKKNELIPQKSIHSPDSSDGDAAWLNMPSSVALTSQHWPWTIGTANSAVIWCQAKRIMLSSRIPYSKSI